MTSTKLIIGGVLLFVVFLIILWIFPVVVIRAGSRGVVFSNVNGVQDRVLGEGLHFRNPFIDAVKTFDVRVQKNEVTASAASKDLQTVTTKVVVNYHLDAGRVNKIYQSFPDEQSIVDRVIVPNTNEIVKAATARYAAEELLTKRAELKIKIDSGLSERLKSYHVILDDVSIVDIDFSEGFNQAIEAKARSIQEAQKAQNDLRRVEFEAQQKVRTAQADAESIRIQAEALAENQQLVEWEAVKKWKGEVPHTVLGGNVVPFINIGN